MQEHAHAETSTDPEVLLRGDNPYLGKHSGVLVMAGLGIAAVGLVAAFALGAGAGDGMRAFWFAYLVGFIYWLSLSLGGLIFVCIQHITRASWSVVVRRIAEYVACNVSTLLILVLPILLIGLPSLYIWLNPQAIQSNPLVDADRVRELIAHKAIYLNRGFFIFRILFYFAFWIWLSRYFLGRSLKQDASGDPDITRRVWVTSAPCTLLYALTSTFAAFDLIMSLSPGWFSTMFGVYFFAGCFVSFMAFLGLSVVWLQCRGHLGNAITLEHYHDIGKLTFAFTLFWAYIGFSQFMLIWYANIPEETFWFKLRTQQPWQVWAVVLLFGHFFIPFAGLMSRWVKRKVGFLAFWCAWLLIMHWMDIAWLILPEMKYGELPSMLLPIAATIGIGGIFIASLGWTIGAKAIIPIRDPRLVESLQFDNIKV